MSTVADDLLKKIKANQPEVLTADNDFLGTIPKGDMIKGFLDSLLDREDTDIQMIALYGEWGSGKTSLMKYIQSKLDEEPKNFATIFFEAWQFENDKNLAMSLLTSLLKKNEVEGNVWQKKDEILKRLKILTKSAFAGYSFGYNASKLVEIFEEESSDDSFHAALDSFKTEYRSMEDNLLKDIQNEKRKFVVFIDDLDRCEPENVLNLLSAIKLFFTFGKRTIFICGLDEKAVDEAVKVKYKDVVKSGEYMEKIFDISFDMPKPDVKKMIAYYFNDNASNKETPISADDLVIIDRVQKFFEAMHFTNPRHIKKVLNKYLLLRYYQERKLDIDELIPNQSIEFFRYLTLFIIMLYKFEHEGFETIKNYEAKIDQYVSTAINSDTRDLEIFMERMIFNQSVQNVTIKGILRGAIYSGTDSNGKTKSMSLLQMYGITAQNSIDQHAQSIFVTLFSPMTDNFTPLSQNNFKIYRKQFYKEKNLLSMFCSFIENNYYLIKEIAASAGASGNSEYRLWTIFDMAERYL